MDFGMSQNWSTVLAAIIIVIVAVSIVKSHEVPPVVLVTAVLPLGAAVPMFFVINEIINNSSLTGIATGDSSVALITNAGKVFTTSLAIALGLGIGIEIVRYFKKWIMSH
jgi:uncharacterized membrane protein YjjB (DUF3815 family)